MPEPTSYSSYVHQLGYPQRRRQTILNLIKPGAKVKPTEKPTESAVPRNNQQAKYRAVEGQTDQISQSLQTDMLLITGSIGAVQLAALRNPRSKLLGSFKKSFTSKAPQTWLRSTFWLPRVGPGAFQLFPNHIRMAFGLLPFQAEELIPSIRSKQWDQRLKCLVRG